MARMGPHLDAPSVHPDLDPLGRVPGADRLHHSLDRDAEGSRVSFGCRDAAVADAGLLLVAGCLGGVVGSGHASCEMPRAFGSGRA